MRYVVFDIETATAVPDDAPDWRVYYPLGISCAATVTEDGQARLWHGAAPDDAPALPHRMSAVEARALADYLRQCREQGCRIVTWNGVHFDFDVLAVECEDPDYYGEVAALALQSTDPAFQMHAEKGFMCGLRAACAGMRLEGKRDGMEGRLAPMLWCGCEDAALRDSLRARFSVEPGSRAAQQVVLDYVVQDARATAALYQALLTRDLHWTTRRGTLGQWRPRRRGGDLLTAEACLELPAPDTAWMSEPRPLRSLIAWMDLAPTATPDDR